MKQILVFISLIVLAFTSCDSESIYTEYQSVGQDLSWNVEDVKTFEFSIEEDGSYDVNIMISYITGYPWDKARVNFRLEGEGLSKEMNSYEITIQDGPGEYRGEPSLDYWLVSDAVLKGQELKSGTYTAVLSHDMPKDEFPYISEIGIRITAGK